MVTYLIGGELHHRDGVEGFELDEFEPGRIRKCCLEHRIGLDLRDEVLVPVLDAWESRLRHNDVVGRLVVFEDRDLPVGAVSILGGEKEGHIGRELVSDGLEAEDSLGLSAHQLVPH